MHVTIRYHVGWLGPIPPSAFETEIRERLISESEGQAFRLEFEPIAGTGFIPTGEQVSVTDGRRNLCAQWEDIIGNAILPEAVTALKERYASR